MPCHQSAVRDDLPDDILKVTTVLRGKPCAAKNIVPLGISEREELLLSVTSCNWGGNRLAFSACRKTYGDDKEAGSESFETGGHENTPGREARRREILPATRSTFAA